MGGQGGDQHADFRRLKQISQMYHFWHANFRRLKLFFIFYFLFPIFYLTFAKCLDYLDTFTYSFIFQNIQETQ